MTEPSGPGRTLTPKPGTRRSAKRRGWWSTLPGILTASAGRSEPPARPGAAPARQTERTLAVPAESEVVLEDGRLVVALKGMRLRPYSADRQRLTLTVRFTTAGSSFARTYSTDLRLVVGGVEIAPEDPPVEQIDAHSSREFDYRFVVPRDARAANLRVIHGEESQELPLDLSVPG